MDNTNFESFSLKIIEKMQIELKEMELICADYVVKERIQKLLELIELETKENKIILSELIQDKIKETRGVNSELNTNFYMLYRKLAENKISILEAKGIYEMYTKEFRNS